MIDRTQGRSRRAHLPVVSSAGGATTLKLHVTIVGSPAAGQAGSAGRGQPVVGARNRLVRLAIGGFGSDLEEIAMSVSVQSVSGGHRGRRLLSALGLLLASTGAGVASDGVVSAASEAKCDTTIEPGTHVLNVDGYDVLLYVPHRAPERQVPLVVNLHPSGGTGAQMLDNAGLYGGTAAADAHGFAVLAPTGVAAPMFGGQQWNVPGVPLFLGLPIVNDRDDVEFIGRAIDAASAAMCVDQARIYATGFSGGARMASQLACDLSDRIAAVAPIGGVRFPMASDAALGLPDSAECDPVRAVPVLAIHGALDTTNPWDTGTPGTSWSYSAETAVDRWARHNSCRATPRVSAMTDNVDLVEYRACHGNGDVSVVFVKDGTHTIPGYPLPWAPVANMEIDGNLTAWDLLSSYRLEGVYANAR